MSASTRRSVRALPIAAALLVTHAAIAQPRPQTAKIPPATSLRSRLGIEAARPLLQADATELRLRAFERLGATGTSAAIELLAEALESGGAARSARERLSVVRELAPHAREERARGALVRAMGGALARDEPADALVRQTAALALSGSGHGDALLALSQALRQPGRVSETARLALRAHPPKRLAPVLEARGVPTPALAGLLGDLGDPAGAPLVARLARTGAPALRAEALLALFKLDRPAALALARASFSREQHRSLRVAAARVLARGRDAAAHGALASLLAEPAFVGDALSIALETPAREFSPLLARLAPGDPGDTERLFAALGRSGGRAALERLEQALARAETAWAAAYALALSPDAGAEEVLERALGRPATRREALRAAVLRERARGESVSGVGAALKALERSKLAADRAAWAFCRAALRAEHGTGLVLSRDSIVAGAAARAALEPELAVAAARRLALEPDGRLRAVLAVSLVVPEAADEVPNAVLVALLESRGAAAHLGAYALAARDGADQRPRLRELMASGDPWLRAHVALGLARSKDASAVGLLDQAYRVESEPEVRRAIVTTLSRRAEPGRRRTLELAAKLDPDDRTRTTARGALAGHEPRLDAGTRGTAWMMVDPAGDGDGRLAVIATPEGLALPLMPDPDGSVTLVGLPQGPVSVALASAAPGGDSPRRGSK